MIRLGILLDIVISSIYIVTIVIILIKCVIYIYLFDFLQQNIYKTSFLFGMSDKMCIQNSVLDSGCMLRINELGSRYGFCMYLVVMGGLIFVRQ